MKLIIEIDEEEYKQIINNERYMPTSISQIIKNGTPTHTSLKKSYRKTYVSDGEAIKGANDTLRNLGMNYFE